MKFQHLIPFIFLFSTLLAKGQELFNISGKVKGLDEQPVHSGEVKIITASDSSDISKTFISAGQFKLDAMKKGNYLLKVTSLGFREKIQPLLLNESMQLVIVLEPSVTTLKEVTITGSKQTFSYKDGNVIINVENSEMAAIPDPMDLISKLPAVQVSADKESVSVVGKGEPLIYIDNQKMTMNDLKSLAVSDIKTIELINNPSSKYEAEGRSVLLITRKINKKEGVKGELSETVAYRKYFLSRASTNVSIRKKKLELKGNIQYNHLKTWEGNAFEFQISRRNIFTRYSVTAVTTRRPQFIAGAGAFYQINEGDYFSISTNIRNQEESFPIYTASYLSTGSVEKDVLTSSENRQPNWYYSSNLNYNKKLKKGNGLFFAGLQHTGYHKDLNSTISNSFNNSPPGMTQIRRQLTNIEVFAARADLEKTFKNEMKWETGSSITYATSKGSSDIRNYDPAEQLNSQYDYNEKNFAAYLQVSGKLKKIHYSGGLRLENTNVENNYGDNGSASTLNKNSTQLFPKVNVVIPVDSSKTITLRYARSITRPNYSDINQRTVYINPYFEWANNIDLNPSVTQEVSTTFQLSDYSVMVSLYQVKGAVNSNFEYDDQLTRLRRTDINYDGESGVYISTTIPFKYKLWSSTNVMNIIYNSIKDRSAVTGESRPFFYYYTSNEFRLPKKFTFTVSGWAVTKSYQGVFERNALFAIDTSLSKTINKNLVCTVRFNNMFASINAEEKFTVNDVAANGVFYDNSREISVGLKYSFGKLSDSRYKNREVDESGNRVK